MWDGKGITLAFSTTERTYFDLNSFRKLIQRTNFAFTLVVTFQACLMRAGQSYNDTSKL